MGLIWIFIAIGGLVGGYLPVLLGADGFSIWAILGSMVGSIVGVWFFKKLDL